MGFNIFRFLYYLKRERLGCTGDTAGSYHPLCFIITLYHGFATPLTLGINPWYHRGILPLLTLYRDKWMVIIPLSTLLIILYSSLIPTMDSSDQLLPPSARGNQQPFADSAEVAASPCHLVIGERFAFTHGALAGRRGRGGDSSQVEPIESSCWGTQGAQLLEAVGPHSYTGPSPIDRRLGCRSQWWVWWCPWAIASTWMERCLERQPGVEPPW